jgi:hypothetical protein
MKETIINTTNETRITAELEEVQNRAKERTIDLYDIKKAVESIQKTMGIPKKALEGCEFDVNIHAQKFPSAYKWAPSYTTFSVTMKGGKWRLTDIRRTDYWTGTAKVHSHLTDEAKQALIEKYERIYDI